MNKKIITLFSALAASAFMLAGCSPKETHTHSLEKVEAKTPTCTEDGYAAHYECTSCGKLYSDESATNEVTLESITQTKTGHTYGSPTYTWDDTTRICTAYKVCASCGDRYSEVATMTNSEKSSASCTEDQIITYTATFTDPDFKTQTKDYVGDEKTGHNITDFVVSGELTNKSYVSGQTISLAGLSFSGTCSHGDSVVINTEDIVVEYANGGSTFLAGETSVTLKYGGFSKTLTVNKVSKRSTSITGLESTYNLYCHESFNESSVHASYGELRFSYVDKDGNEATKDTLSEAGSPYNLTVIVEANNETDGAAATAVINVSHNFESSAECGCGVKSVENLFIGLTETGYEIFTDNATGLYASFVKNPDAEWFNAEGSGALEVSASDAGSEIDAVVVVGEEAVRVKAMVCSKVIKDVASLKEAMNMWYTSKDSGGDHGYYILVNDLINAGNLGEIRVANEFSGTFNGLGHTISGFNAWGYGLFGDINGATIKNVKLLGAKNNRLTRSVHGSVSFENFEYNLATGYTICGTGSLMSSFDGQLSFSNVTISGIDKATDVIISDYDSAYRMPQFTNTVIKCHPEAKLVARLSEGSKAKAEIYGEDFRPQLEGLTYIDSVGIEVDETIYADIARQEFDFSEVTKDLTGWTISNLDNGEMDWSSVTPGEGKITIKKDGEKSLTYNIVYATTIVKTAEDFKSLQVENGNPGEKVTKTGYWVLGNDISNVVMDTTMDEIKEYFGLDAGASLSASNYLTYAQNHIFAGTIDGRGFKVNGLTVSCHTYIGMFSGICVGATFKNLDIDGLKTGWGANGGNYQMFTFGYSVMSTTFENMNIKLAPATGALAGAGQVGILARDCTNRVVLRNINIDLNNVKNNGSTFFSLFANYGASEQYSAVTENIHVTNLYEGYTMYFAYSKGSNGVLDMSTCTGFTSPLK